MFRKEKTVQAPRVHVHFLDRFSIEYIFEDLVGPRCSPSVTETVKWRLPYYMTVRREDPNVSILHLSKLYLVFIDSNVIFGDEFEDFLDITLIVSEAIHVIHGV